MLTRYDQGNGLHDWRSTSGSGTRAKRVPPCAQAPRSRKPDSGSVPHHGDQDQRSGGSFSDGERQVHLPGRPVRCERGEGAEDNSSAGLPLGSRCSAGKFVVAPNGPFPLARGIFIDILTLNALRYVLLPMRRTEKEYAAGHAPKAVNIPFAHAGMLGMSPNPDFVEQVGCDGWLEGGCFREMVHLSTHRPSTSL